MPLLVDDIPFEPGPAELIPDDAVAPPALDFELSEAAEELSAEWAEVIGRTGPVLEFLERESADQLTALGEISAELDAADRDLGELGDAQEEAELAAMEEELPNGERILGELERDFPAPPPATPPPLDPEGPDDEQDFELEDDEFDFGGFGP